MEKGDKRLIRYDLAIITRATGLDENEISNL